MVRLSASLLVLAGLRLASAVTPVEKVIDLLQSLQKKVEQEGADEAAAYDKYACFCKEQVDEKQYNIEKSTAKIEQLSAEIDKLTSEIGSLNTEIGDLAAKITTKEGESKLAQEERDGEHETYLGKADDAAKAIDACERAIAALKESKSQLGGKAKLEKEFVQIRAMAATVLAASSSVSVLSDAQLDKLGKLAQPGQAYTSEYHSNEIIATIEGLHESFTKIKAQLDEEEFDLATLHDKKQLSLKNEMKFAEKEKGEKEALVADKTEAKEAKEGDKVQESKDKASDKAFQTVLTTECQAKAELWDQRSVTRSSELTAISEAIGALKEGVAPNWQANKKLSGIQRKSKVVRAAAPEVPKGHWQWVEDAPQTPASFLQLRGSLRSASAEVKAAEKAREVLVNAGNRLRSKLLSAAALRVRVSEDHFVKVREIIKDLLKRLDDQATAEASQKSFCDKEMARETTGRDTQQSKVEDYKAQIEVKESEKAQLLREIADLSKAIAENKKALKEATELRDAERIENEKTVVDAGAGKVAVEQAIQFLKQFYEGAAFTQYVPPNSDREGLTVSDRAPEVFDSEYKGSQDSSKGIIGMLEVILTDFDRTVSTVTTEETDAEAAFTSFKTANELDTQTKEASVTTKEGEVTDAEAALVDLANDQKAAADLLEGHIEALEKLKPMCIDGEETYVQRAEKRKQEIEALKEAHDILENWKGF